MKVNKYTKYIWELENFISDEDIDRFLELNDLANQKPIETFRNPNRDNDTYEYRGDSQKEIDDMAWGFINKAHYYYLANNTWVFYRWNNVDYYDSNVKWEGKNILRVYNTNDQYNWHSDHSGSDIAEFSYIVYLNDQFEGGNTLFLNDKLKVTPKKGSVLCFPVDHYHIHKSTKIKSGCKKILWNCLYRNKITTVSMTSLSNVSRRKAKSIW